MIDLDKVNITIAGLRAHYQAGDFSAKELIGTLQLAWDKVDDNPVWTTRLNQEQLQHYLDKLDTLSVDDFPLYGIPFAIKDNIDLAGVPTTAACLDFTYTPSENAFVVQQLLNAGAIPLGKTNMDQFATGLVGVRSPEPWGPCKNALNPEIISGGSSSGSAVAVAKGLVSFSLGTDTAGSGRVPASLNNIVGLKPTRGLLSNRGVVPACKTLDCISIFALSADDANTVFNVAAQYDAKDSYSRANKHSNGKRYFSNNINASIKIGVPKKPQLEFFDNQEAENLFQQSLNQLEKCGAELIPIDFEPFSKAAKLLYEGPWVSERTVAIEAVKSDSLLPVIKQIVRGGKPQSAEEVFKAQYLLADYKRQADGELAKVDMVVMPTAATYFSINEVINDPIALNSAMGYYTNFMNLLDYAAVSVPSGFYNNKVGFGVTLFKQAFADKELLSLASVLQQHCDLPLGATPLKAIADSASSIEPSGNINVVVCGAHLEGLPLNWQLSERGATLKASTTTSSNYRFYALAGGPPKRPGLIRDTENGAAIEVEVWRVPKENFGSFVAEIPHPLGIGKVELADGSWCSGFICEPEGIDGAEEITQFQSWKNYLHALAL